MSSFNQAFIGDARYREINCNTKSGLDERSVRNTWHSRSTYQVHGRANMHFSSDSRVFRKVALSLFTSDRLQRAQEAGYEHY